MSWTHVLSLMSMVGVEALFSFAIFINVEVHQNGFPTWRLTGFYGFSERVKRRESWDLIRKKNFSPPLPWCIARYFNDLLSPKEKLGNRDHPNWLIQGFHEVVLDSGLHDLTMEGYKYTWTKSKGKTNAIEEKFDRAMANLEWLDMFPNFKFRNTMALKSDHSLTHLILDSKNQRQ